MISALFLSAAFHLVLVYGLHWQQERHPPQIAKRRGSAPFSVQLVPVGRARLRPVLTAIPRDANVPVVNNSTPTPPSTEITRRTLASGKTLDGLGSTEDRKGIDMTMQPPVFLDADIMDYPALPRLQPDLDPVMDQIGKSGKEVLPIRIRVYILETGFVYRVEILKAAAEDLWIANEIVEAFRDIRFVPGQRGGRDAASWQDYEFGFVPQDPMRPGAASAPTVEPM